jgi:hypothetical protein
VFLTAATLTDLPALARREGLAHGVRVLDDFKDIEHLTSALVLSSYVPGGTGRLFPPEGSSVARARAGIAKHWGLKLIDRTWSECREDLSRLEPFPQPMAAEDERASSEGVKDPTNSTTTADQLFDGGLGAMWPTLDSHTVLVSPLAVRPLRREAKTRGVICPPGKFVNSVPLGAHGVLVDGTMETVRRASRMLMSSQPSELDKAFAQGFDDARRFLRDGGSL